MVYAVQTQVRKRENDRQKEQRISSYAHLAAEESKEPWQTLRYVGADRQDAPHVPMLWLARARMP